MQFKKTNTFNPNMPDLMIYEGLNNSFVKSLSIKASEVPRAWLKLHGLTCANTGIGFNSGQLHYGRGEGFKQALINIGFLKFTRKNSRGVDGYKTFGNYGMMFPLKDKKGNIVNFASIPVKSNQEEELLNNKGVYPAYPHEMITRIVFATTMLDAATLLESKNLKSRECVISIPRGEPFEEHLSLLNSLPGLQQILWIQQTQKGENMNNNFNRLKQAAGKIPVKRIVLPENENLNKVFLREGSAGIQKLLDSSSELEEMTEVENVPVPLPSKMTLPEEDVVILPLQSPVIQRVMEVDFSNPLPISYRSKSHSLEDSQEGSPKLETISEHKLLLQRPLNDYYVLGSLSQDLSGLRITLMVEEKATGRRERTKLDLYEREQLNLYVEQLSGLYEQPSEELEADLLLLTDLLETYREKQVEKFSASYKNEKRTYKLSLEKQSACIQFLKGNNLLQSIDELIHQAGVVGEESTRRLLYVIASTYKMSSPLHSLVQGTSGSGKSHLINTIGECFPPEDVISMTRVTSKSFYHYTKDELVDKLILIQDYDGLDEEAQFAFRELQSAGNISSSTTYKDRYGNLMSAVKTVRSHFASLLATTKAEIYYDNMSRSLITGVDEGDEQTRRIIIHQNQKLAGLIDTREEKKAKEFLQNCMRCIQPMEVVNPFADKVYLPFEAKMLRRLNSHYQAFVKQITILHQYQRQKDDRGRLIAELGDLKLACDIMFDAIMLKIDDLDSSMRQFFDRMKEYIKKQSSSGKEKEYQFTQRDVRLALNVSKTQCFRYFEELELLEYLQRTGGYANRGFKYKIVFWDDITKTRQKIKDDLKNQLDAIVPVVMERQIKPQQGD